MASNRVRLLLTFLLIICNGPFFASSMDEASKEVSEEESSSLVESENGEHTAPIEDGPDEVEVEEIGETPSSIEEIIKPAFRKSERKSEAKVSIEATYPVAHCVVQIEPASIVAFDSTHASSDECMFVIESGIGTSQLNGSHENIETWAPVLEYINPV